MNKRIIYFSFSLIVAFTLSYFIHNQPDKKILNTHEIETITYKKDKDRKIASYTTSIEEKIDVNILKRNKNPKILEKKSLKNPNYYYYKNYRLIGANAILWNESTRQLKMENSESSEWKNQLGENLLSFQASDTKVIIDEEENIIKVQEDSGIFLKQVSVHFLFANGETRAFRALVNAENGKIEESWDGPIHEKKTRYSFELSGLKDANVN